MGEIDKLIVFFVTDLFMCLTPGPVVMAVTAQQLTGKTRGTLGLMGGIHFGNFIWYTLVAMGFITLIKNAPNVFYALQLGGLLFLLYLGVKALRSGDVASVQKAEGKDLWSGFATGLAIHMANPKALLFYSVILPPFIDAQQPILPQIAALALITIMTETIGMSSYAFAAWRVTKLDIAVGHVQMLNRMSGVILIVAAILLFWRSL
jgi:homoserine/homoserine lactone efflux protein